MLDLSRFNWDIPVTPFSTSGRVGRLSPHPAIAFDISRHIVRWNSLAQEDEWGNFYAVSCAINGNYPVMEFNTKDEVINYLIKQEALLPQYLILIGKRAKISERIEPLLRKQSKYANDILKLAKQR